MSLAEQTRIRAQGILDGRPLRVRCAEWAFHPGNPQRLPPAAGRLYALVTRSARRCGWAFASSEYPADRLGKEVKGKKDMERKSRF